MTLTPHPAPRRAAPTPPTPTRAPAPDLAPPTPEPELALVPEPIDALPEGHVLHGLNAQQRAAVTHGTGVLVVIAGAGSGKTRVIERRARHLIESGTPPEQLLLLTFTKRAANEMRERIDAHHAMSGLTATTFHSFAYQMLRELQPHLDYPRVPIVIDTDDSARLLGELARKHDAHKPLPGRVLHALHSARVNRSLTLVDAITRDAPDLLPRADEIRDLIGQYQELKTERALLDFDDLLTHFEKLLADPNLAPLVTDRFAHVLVDEFQDVNALQARLTWLLAPHRNLTIVGDPSQSIYRFRGARVESLEEALAQQHATVVRLEENYRSEPPILALANEVLAQMPREHQLRLRTRTRSGGRAPEAVAFGNPHDEARGALAWVRELQRAGRSLDEIAILYRSSHLNIPLQGMLLRESVPFRTFGGSSLTSTAHVKDLLAFVRVVSNPEDGMAVRRVAVLYPGIGPATARDIGDSLTFNAPEDLRAMSESARGGSAKGMRSLADLIELAWRQTTFPKMFGVLMEHYQPLLERTYDRVPQRQRDLEALHEIARGYEDGMQLVSDLMLDTSLGDTVDEEPLERTVSLTLSTIHAAKGLEWPFVLVYGASDDHLPHYRSVKEDGEEGLREERRLCYVALTRAQEAVRVSYTRHPNADAPESEVAYSRFLTVALPPRSP